MLIYWPVTNHKASEKLVIISWLPDGGTTLCNCTTNLHRPLEATDCMASYNSTFFSHLGLTVACCSCQYNRQFHGKATPQWHESTVKWTLFFSYEKGFTLHNQKDQTGKSNLQTYQCIDHPTTGKRPTEVLFNRKIRGKLPEITASQKHLETRPRKNMEINHLHK